MEWLPERDLEHILEHTRSLWDELKGERLFITGGTGFFGRWLLESFLFANDRLTLNAQATLLTRRPAHFQQAAPHIANHPAITLIEGDVRDFDFPERTFSHVIHAATESGSTLNADDPVSMLETTIAGTRRTLDFAVSHGARRFLLTSSGAVYGRQPAEIPNVPETYAGAPDTSDPASAYGEGKRASELLCSLYHRKHGLEAKVARCFAFSGPHLPLDAHYAIGNFIRDAVQGGPIVVKGDGTPFRSYLYAADLAIWLWTILFAGKASRPYNVGSSEAMTIAAIAHSVAALGNPPLRVEIKEPPAPHRPPARYVPATARARAELGLGVLVPFDEQLRRMFSWARKG